MMGIIFIVLFVLSTIKYANIYTYIALFIYASQKIKQTFQKEKFVVEVFFIVETTLILLGFGYLSRYMQPLYTTGRFQWFIPILICVVYAKSIFLGDKDD